MFNADPHPGNYLFHDDGTVTFLDFGCVKRMSPEAQRGFWEMPVAAIDNDADRLLRVYVEQGFASADDPPPAEKLLAWMRQNFASLHLPHSNVPKDFLFTNRIFVGLYSVLARGRRTDRGRHRSGRSGQDEVRVAVTPSACLLPSMH